MRLYSTDIKNFGAIRRGTYLFTDGLNIIRGENEDGKSTVIEAVLYSMFGTAMIRGTVDEAITLDETSMWVESVYGPYTVKRSKSSAEVTGPEVHISGQGNVSDFFFTLLGVEKDTTKHVLVSEQGKTAGILDSKPTAVTTLIEQLAGFGQIDDLTKKVQDKYPSGDKAIYTGMLDELKEKIAAAETAELPDTSPTVAKLKELKASKAANEARVDANLAAIQTVKTKIGEISAASRHKEAVGQRLRDAKSNVDRTRDKIVSLTIASKKRVEDCTEEEKYISEYPKLKGSYYTYTRILELQAESAVGSEWEGGLESFMEEHAEVKARAKALEHDIGANTALIFAQEARINTSDTCITCGQDTKHLHAEINESAREKLHHLMGVKEGLSTQVSEINRELEILEEILLSQNRRAEYKGYVSDFNIVPWPLKWDKDIPTEPSATRLKQCQDIVKKWAAVKAEVDQAKTSLPEEKARVKELENYVLEIEEEYEAIIVPEVGELGNRLDALNNLLTTQRLAIKQTKAEITTLEKAVRDVEAEAKLKAQILSSLEADKLGLIKKIEKDEANSIVLKAMRAAKPIVLSRVWNRILVAVSTVFSDMRNEPTTVEKQEKGFYANGLPVHRLSGSARSVLGIAVRQTLRDVFAPAAGFLIFDEPFAGCSAKRMALVVGAIASIPGQVIVITHEEMSDASADNIIEV